MHQKCDTGRHEETLKPDRAQVYQQSEDAPGALSCLSNDLDEQAYQLVVDRAKGIRNQEKKCYTDCSYDSDQWPEYLSLYQVAWEPPCEQDNKHTGKDEQEANG